ncbi:MAG TPA: prepilin-type N-terminal cleavage/methylation domain-containing protein [Syntrophales bacterium]|nr:prepilin-type N-terminal cleavage/methylation domain-containing protein [Syntrophales bacterium]
MNNSRGFTLIEILVAAVVSLIMLFAIGTAIESALRSSGGIERKVTAQQDVRAALELMAMEIRMASYNPTFADTLDNPARMWHNPDCSFPSANPGWRGVQAATSNTITVEMDISGAAGDGNGSIGEPNEIISYNYVSAGAYGSAGADRLITRNTNCGGAQPFLGDFSASGNPRTVKVINSDLGIPIFRYFDGWGNLIPVDANGNIINAGIQVPNIRTIEITLAVETDEINPDTKLPRRMIYSTREILRNN